MHKILDVAPQDLTLFGSDNGVKLSSSKSINMCDGVKTLGTVLDRYLTTAFLNETAIDYYAY